MPPAVGEMPKILNHLPITSSKSDKSEREKKILVRTKNVKPHDAKMFLFEAIEDRINSNSYFCFFKTEMMHSMRVLHTTEIITQFG